MKKTSRIARLMALMFASAALLSACGGGGGNGSASSPQPEAPPASPVDTVAASVETLMNRLRTESASGGFSLDAFLGVDAAVLESRQSVLDLTLTSREAESGEIRYLQSSLIAENDEAAFQMELSGGEESYRSGAYFSGSSMLLRFADANKPMIRYTLGDGRAAALSGQPPLKRYMACLASPDPASVLGGGWDGQWAALRAQLQRELADSDVVQEEMPLTIQGQDRAASACRVQLAGAPAVEAMACFCDAWNGDGDVRAFVCLADNAAEDDGDAPLPGTTLSLLDAAIRNARATGEAGGALSLTVGLLEDVPVYQDLRFTLPEGEFALTMTFWSEGKAGQTDIRLRAFDGRGFDLRDTNRDGGGVFQQETVQTLYLPGGATSAVNTLTAANAYESGGLHKTFSNEYRAMDREGGTESLALAQGEYAHTGEDGEVNGALSGQLTLEAQGDDPMTLDYSGTLLLSRQAGQVTIPEFIPGSGQELQDHPALLAALLKDQAPTYGAMPYSQQMMLAAMALMQDIDA